jgi:shikimate kinase
MAPGRNLILTGFMGTGKTTVGRGLADRLGMPFIDTDRVIEEQHGPIDRIFAELGEAEFREIERSVAVEVSHLDDHVVATGGRMLLDPANLRVLAVSGRIFCLVASPEEIYRRLSVDGSPAKRPLLATSDPERRIRELLAERAAGYGRFTQVSTDSRDVAEVVEELVDLWEADEGP